MVLASHLTSKMPKHPNTSNTYPRVLERKWGSEIVSFVQVFFVNDFRPLGLDWDERSEMVHHEPYPPILFLHVPAIFFHIRPFHPHPLQGKAHQTIWTIKVKTPRSKIKNQRSKIKTPDSKIKTPKPRDAKGRNSLNVYWFHGFRLLSRHAANESSTPFCTTSDHVSISHFFRSFLHILPYISIYYHIHSYPIRFFKSAAWWPTHNLYPILGIKFCLPASLLGHAMKLCAGSNTQGISKSSITATPQSNIIQHTNLYRMVTSNPVTRRASSL